MIYKEEFHPKFKSDLKKIDKQAIQEIKEFHLNKILNNPHKADNLKGNLSNLKSYHFKCNRVEYRIVYEVVEESKVIFYYMVAKRENFYKKLHNRV